jgi:hypothetical protein
MTMFFCPKCGADRRMLAPIAACGTCGFKLEVPASRLQSPVSSKEKTQRHRIVLLAATAVVLASSVVAVVVAFGLGSGSDQRATTTPVVHHSSPVPAASVEPPAPAKPAPPRWFVLRIDRVQAARNGIEWDGPVDETSSRDACRSIAGLAGIVIPAARSATLACSLVRDDQRQADPRDPDLQLLIEAPSVRYESYVAFDRRNHLFDYAFVVPSAALAADGLLISVVDADIGADRGQEIGSVRLTLDELTDLATKRTVGSRTAENLSLLEIAVGPYDGTLMESEVKIDAAIGGASDMSFKIHAGDIVRIEAEGTWQIGHFYDQVIGPSGYPNSAMRSGNLAAFKDEPHGAAVALVGSQGKMAKVSVNPCIKFVSPYAGSVWVGINDQSNRDNRGSALFRLLKRGPSAAQWMKPGAIFRCD